MAKKLDDGVVKAERGFTKVSASRQSKFPWETMRVGESFVTPVKAGAGPRYNMAYNASKRHKPKAFSAGRGNDGKMRVWRDK